MFQRNWSPKLHFRESWEVNRISGRMDYEKILLTKFLSGKPTWLLQENCVFNPLMNLSTFLSSLWASLWLHLICCYSFLKHHRPSLTSLQLVSLMLPLGLFSLLYWNLLWDWTGHPFLLSGWILNQQAKSENPFSHWYIQITISLVFADISLRVVQENCSKQWSRTCSLIENLVD